MRGFRISALVKPPVDTGSGVLAKFPVDARVDALTKSPVEAGIGVVVNILVDSGSARSARLQSLQKLTRLSQ